MGRKLYHWCFVIIGEVNKMLWIIFLLAILFAGMEYGGHVISKIFVPAAIVIIAVPPIIYYLIFKNFTALTTVSITLDRKSVV